MSSTSVVQFGIRHILVGLVLFSIGMGLFSSGIVVVANLGVMILTGTVGVFFSYSMMFFSDLIDSRRIDDRRWISRAINFTGLLIFGWTWLLVILLGAWVFFQSILILMKTA